MKECRSVTFDCLVKENIKETAGEGESQGDYDSNDDITQSDDSNNDSENEDSEETSQHNDNEHSTSECNSDKDEFDDESKVPTIPDAAYKEDIYGRLRDEEGNVVENSGNVGSYVPPGKRLALAKATDEKKKLELERMKKKLKGLINR